jgi:mRNA-degrading endonuclease RelE of RelBE toxin-antitoxin system
MDEAEKAIYQVEITPSAESTFFDVLDYLTKYYTEDRAIEIANEVRQLPFTLNIYPNRGTLDKTLTNRDKEYRYLSYKRTKRSEIKIIYTIEEHLKKVYVLAFHPSESDTTKLEKVV